MTDFSSFGRRLTWMLAILTAVAWLPSKTHAWGKDGHELVGNIAWKLLSNDTQAVVRHILVDHPVLLLGTINNNNNTPLGAVADWADQIRVSHDWHWSGALHYIDIHDNLVDGGCPVFDETPTEQQNCRFMYDRDCANNICVAGAIVNYTQHLAAWKNNVDETSMSKSSASSRHLQVSNENEDQQESTTPRRISSRLRTSSSLVAPWSSAWSWNTESWWPVWWKTRNTPVQTKLKQPSMPLPTKLVQESLMFLTHFVGDIHQPLHSARTTDRGGNTIDVTFDSATTGSSTGRANRNTINNLRHQHHKLELHAVWDTNMIEKAIHTEYYGHRDALEDELLQSIQTAKQNGDMDKWLACSDTSQYDHCTSLWAQESFDNAMTWAYANVVGNSSDTSPAEVVSGTHLTEEYYETRMPRIKEYLMVAGVRLAASLEQTLGSSSR